MNGREHWFVNEDKMPAKETMLAYTYFGNAHYWTSKWQVPLRGICTYIIDEKALVEMQKKFSYRFKIIPVYIRRNNLSEIDQERKDRDMERIVLQDSEYAAIIENNGTLEEFLTNASQIIKNLL